VKTLTAPGLSLNLEDEILVRGVNVTYQKFDCFPMGEFSQKFKTFCVNLCATKFEPKLLTTHPKSYIIKNHIKTISRIMV
jgi:hypothetical protein